jgi:hypothetical protein
VIVSPKGDGNNEVDERKSVMGLGLAKSDGGDFKPIIKYDARAGRIFRIDRDGTTSNTVEITNGFSAVFDLANIKVGWVLFAEGGAPDWAMVKIGEPLPARPSKDHKQGFRLDIKLAKSAGGDVRDFASAAGCVIGAMDSLYDAYAAAPEAKAGKLPVVALTGTTVTKTGQATNYAPIFVIRQWVDRPADLQSSVAYAANGAAKATGHAPAANVPPPVQQAQAPAMADADEF